MRNFFENFGVALSGLVTSIIVVIANVVIERKTGFNLFSLSIWFVIPMGAILTGMAAASGYYFGSLYFHKRANKLLLMQMVFIAAFTQFMIYWFGYVTMVTDKGINITNFVSFSRYLDILWTSAHYRGVRSQIDIGAVGSFGYWLAGLQFAGFLIGGLVIYIFLREKPFCESCNLYLRQLAKKNKSYENSDKASAYYDNLLSHPVDSEEFATLIRSTAKISKTQAGTFSIDTTLLACPQCADQLINEKVNIFNGKEWKSVEKLTRNVRIPAGSDLSAIFQK